MWKATDSLYKKRLASDIKTTSIAGWHTQNAKKKKGAGGGEVEGRKKGKKGGKEKEKYYIHVCLNKHRLELEQYIKNGNMLPLGKLNGRKTELEIFLSITFVPFDFVACEYIIILKQNKTPFNSKSFNVKS